MEYANTNPILLKDIRVILKEDDGIIKTVGIVWKDGFYTWVIKYNKFEFVKEYKTEKELLGDGKYKLIYSGILQRDRTNKGRQILQSMRDIGFNNLVVETKKK